MLNRFVIEYKRLVNSLAFLFFRKEDIILLNAWMDLYGNEIRHNNFGDELNYYIIKNLTGKRVFNKRNIYKLFTRNCNNILFIGSIIEGWTDSNSIIWGAGAIKGEKSLKAKPQKVLSVRGPLTRQYLLSQGVYCPEVYGDPALLVPFIYSPNTKKSIR